MHYTYISEVKNRSPYLSKKSRYFSSKLQNIVLNFLSARFYPKIRRRYTHVLKKFKKSKLEVYIPQKNQPKDWNHADVALFKIQKCPPDVLVVEAVRKPWRNKGMANKQLFLWSILHFQSEKLMLAKLRFLIESLVVDLCWQPSNRLGKTWSIRHASTIQSDPRSPRYPNTAHTNKHTEFSPSLLRARNRLGEYSDSIKDRRAAYFSQVHKSLLHGRLASHGSHVEPCRACRAIKRICSAWLLRER